MIPSRAIAFEVSSTVHRHVSVTMLFSVVTVNLSNSSNGDKLCTNGNKLLIIVVMITTILMLNFGMLSSSWQGMCRY